MNRKGVYIVAYLVNRHTCEHPECAELRRIKSEAWRLRKFSIVNTCELQLARCPDAQKEDDHGAVNAPPPAKA